MCQEIVNDLLPLPWRSEQGTSGEMSSLLAGVIARLRDLEMTIP